MIDPEKPGNVKLVAYELRRKETSGLDKLARAKVRMYAACMNFQSLMCVHILSLTEFGFLALYI